MSIFYLVGWLYRHCNKIGGNVKIHPHRHTSKDKRKGTPLTREFNQQQKACSHWSVMAIMD